MATELEQLRQESEQLKLQILVGSWYMLLTVAVGWFFMSVHKDDNRPNCYRSVDI